MQSNKTRETKRTKKKILRSFLEWILLLSTILFPSFVKEIVYFSLSAFIRSTFYLYKLLSIVVQKYFHTTVLGNVKKCWKDNPKLIFDSISCLLTALNVLSGVLMFKYFLDDGYYKCLIFRFLVTICVSFWGFLSYRKRTWGDYVVALLIMPLCQLTDCYSF